MAVRTYSNAFLVLDDDFSVGVEFQIFPQTIRERKSAVWANIPVLGRAEPVKVYDHSSPRSVDFQLAFFASVDEGDASVRTVDNERDKITKSPLGTSLRSISNATEPYRNFVDVITPPRSYAVNIAEAVRYVQRNVHYLQSFVYPQRQAEPGGASFGPPVLNLVIGEALEMRCVMTTVDVQWSGPWHLDGEQPGVVGRAFRADVSVSVDEISVDTPLTSAEYRSEVRRPSSLLFTGDGITASSSRPASSLFTGNGALQSITGL
jgi:hypothetical protein